MAENTLPTKLTQFDSVYEQIKQIFDPLIHKLTARRDALIQKLFYIQEHYNSLEKIRITALQGVERTYKEVQEVHDKTNIDFPRHHSISEMYNLSVKDLETPTELPRPIFLCTSLESLQSLIDQFGDVVEWEVPNYTAKSKPIQTSKLKPGGNICATGLALDEVNQQIYITDNMSKQVQVVSFRGNQVTEFGKNILECPWGVAVSQGHIFITDKSSNKIFKFSKEGYTFEISKDGLLNNPAGLSVDTNGDVYVADTDNNKVSIFSYSLDFINSIGSGDHLERPKDVKITSDNVVVLDWSSNCVHFFTRNGSILRSWVTQGGGQSLISCPFFFCIDLDGNFIISDYNHHTVKVFSSSGDLIHTVGRRGEGSGQFIRPYGICISNLGILYVVSNNNNNPLQCF